MKEQGTPAFAEATADKRDEYYSDSDGKF